MKKLCFIAYLLFCYSGFAQVDMRNGNSNYTIPVFEHTDAKSGLGTSISLVYNSNGGVKVNEYASEVGLGWNLNAGGFIQRIQNDEPDDQYQVNSFPGLADNYIITERANSSEYENYYPNGYMFGTFPVADVPLEKALLARFPADNQTYKYLQSPRSQADKEQDVFMVNLPGRTTSFVFSANGSYTILDDSKIIVEKEYFTTTEMISSKIRTRIKAFVITDETGVKYRFEDYEKTYLTDNEIESSESSGNPTMSVTKNIKRDKSIISRWCLSKIINPFTNQYIEFVYGNNLNASVLSAVIPNYIEHLPQNPLNQTQRNLSITKFTSFTDRKTLSQVIYPDGFRVAIGPGFYNERYDLGSKLGIKSQITVYDDKNRIIHRMLLKYKYFYRGTYKVNAPYYNDDNDRRFLRLCLESVDIGEAAGIKTYKFDYYSGTPGTSDIVPPMHSMAQDAWGYYRPTTLINDNSAAYDKHPIRDFLQADPATSRTPAAGQAKTGLLKKVTIPTGGTMEFEYEQNDVTDNGQQKYIGGVRVSKVITTDNVTGNPITVEYAYKNANGTSSGWGYDAPDNYRRYTFLHKKNPTPFGETYPVNGVFAKRIGVAYASMMFNGPGVTKMIDMIIPGYGQIKAIVDIALLVASLVDDVANYDVKEWNHTCTMQFNGLQVNYSRIEVATAGANNGKTVYEYTKPANMATDILSNNFPFSAKQRYEYWKYGLPEKTLFYSQNGTLVKSVVNTYNNTTAVLTDPNAKFGVDTYYSAPYDWNVSNAGNLSSGFLIGENYSLKKGYGRITEATETTFGKNGRFLEAKVYYDYTGSTNMLPREVYSYNSRGDQVGVTTYYTSDYTINSGAMFELRNKNILHLPVVKLNWYLPVGFTVRQYTSIAINEFAIAPNGEVKIYKSYKDNNVSAVSGTVVGPFDPNSIFMPYPNLRLISETGFNANGDIVNSKTEGDQKIAYVYDHNGRFAVATVVNAEEKDIAYSSFETAETGNWVMSAVSYTDNRFSPTGVRHALLSSAAFCQKTGLNTGTTYMVSYWSRNGGLAVNGSGATPKLTINGWSYYEHTVTGANQVTVTINTPNSTDVEVDELRLYPSNARMSTVVYDPAYGKIAECDLNNRIKYYKYDKEGRLVMIQDENRNATNTFDYNTKTN